MGFDSSGRQLLINVAYSAAVITPFEISKERGRNNFPIWFQALVGTFAGVRVANAVGLGGSFAVRPKGPRLESPGQRPGDARHDECKAPTGRDSSLAPLGLWGHWAS